MATWTIQPDIAALVRVIYPNGSQVSAVFLNKEKGVVLGLHDRPMKDSDIPSQVQAAINRHFGTVFALEHETWKSKGPSPRAQYCDALQPWSIEMPE